MRLSERTLGRLECRFVKIDTSGTPNSSETIKATAHAETPGTAPTKPLWHYTDAARLHGIVTSGLLRFGYSRVLNDQSESQYGWDLINALLDEEIAQGGRLRDYFFVVKTIANQVVPKNQLFICSLSETEE